MISQPLSAISPCSPLPSGTWWIPGLSIPWCCLPTSFSVCLVFFPLSLCFARWFWPDLMNGRHDHTTAVCVSLRWSGGLRVVRLPVGSWHRLPRWWHGLCMRCVVSCGSTSFPWLYSSLELCCEGPWFTSIHKDGCDKSASVVSWNWDKYSCHSKVVSTLSMLLLPVLSWRVSRTWKAHQL